MDNDSASRDPDDGFTTRVGLSLFGVYSEYVELTISYDTWCCNVGADILGRLPTYRRAEFRL